MVTDSWTNIRSKLIVNYMLVLSNAAIFYKSIPTSTVQHTGVNTRAGIKAVMDKVGSSNIIALTTNNAANIKAS